MIRTGISIVPYAKIITAYVLGNAVDVLGVCLRPRWSHQLSRLWRLVCLPAMELMPRRSWQLLLLSMDFPEDNLNNAKPHGISPIIKWSPSRRRFVISRTLRWPYSLLNLLPAYLQKS